MADIAHEITLNGTPYEVTLYVDGTWDIHNMDPGVMEHVAEGDGFVLGFMRDIHDRVALSDFIELLLVSDQLPEKVRAELQSWADNDGTFSKA